MRNLFFKSGVKLGGMKPEILLAMSLGAEKFLEKGYGTFTVTSVMDGKHKQGSLHYEGKAFDLRIWSIPSGKVEEASNSLRLLLSPLGFQVISEQDHLHIEFDP